MGNQPADEKALKKHIIREYGEALVIAIILALIIRAFVVQAFKIPSSSMEPTLLIGDHLLVNKFIYGIKIPFIDKKVLKFKKPQRGDIIVFKFKDPEYPEKPEVDFIKRVIAVEGERVEIIKKKVFINGKLMPDPYGVFLDDNTDDTYTSPKDNFGPVIVPKDSVFCLGDNRDKSHDGRFWGYVKLDRIRGKAFILYFSWNSNSESLLGKIRWSRFGHLLHE
jgi:signal peptidase I